jgi:hypothetical protein
MPGRVLARDHIDVTPSVAEPRPLITMKLQAVTNRSVDKRGTDLLAIVRRTIDQSTADALVFGPSLTPRLT